MIPTENQSSAWMSSFSDATSIACTSRLSSHCSRRTCLSSTATKIWYMACHMASIGAYILCGGASSRMGQCKTQVLLSGQPLVQYILDTVSGLNFPTHMVCKAHQHTHLENFGCPLVTDLHTSYHPLEGVVTAFSQHKEIHPYFDCSCDTIVVCHQH